MMRQVGRLAMAMAMAALGLTGVVATAAPAAASPAPTVYPWVVHPTANVGTTADNSLAAVSCAPGGYCTAVGYTNAGKADQTLGELWNGTAWEIVPSQNTEPSKDNDLYGDSCVTATFCVAVGAGDTKYTTQTLVEQWSGAGWTIVPSPDTNAVQPQTLYGVSCTTLTFCVAVGSSQSVAGPTDTLVEEWNGSDWSIVPSPDQGTGGFSELTDVSCLSTTWCTAVGDDFNGTVSQTLAEAWNGTAWSVVPTTSPSASVGSVFTSVSCLSPGACTAVGYSTADSGYQNLAQEWNGADWTPMSVPATGPNDDDLLESVSCGSPTSCTAVGSSSPDGSTYANLVEQWDNGVWSVISTPPPLSATSDGELLGVSCTGVWACTAVGDTPDDTPIQTESLAVEPGYWEVARDGGVFSFGSSAFYGSMGGTPLAAPIVGFAPTPDRRGYWEVARDGGIFAFGDATFYGSMGGKPLAAPIVAITATPDGKGYWMVASDGGIFAFGDAQFYGSMGGKPLNEPIVAISSTPDGQGYWMVASDGGIFAFGDAQFYGSMGGKPLNEPIVGITTTIDSGGYWMVASDGGIFAFGDAQFFGSMGGTPLAQPIVQMG